MKNVSFVTYCFSFVGCFLGAGYISGQELYQFFAAFGYMGVVGLVLAIVILGAVSVLLAKLVGISRVSEIDKVVGGNSKTLNFSVAFLEILMFVGTYIVMAAGAGALFEMLSGINGSHYGGSLVFCIVMAFIAVRGMNGLIKIFSYAVPLLVVMTVAVAVINISAHQPSDFVMVPCGKFNPLIPNWAIGGIIFAAYNFFCSIGVLCPLNIRVKKSRTAVLGILAGLVILFAVAMSVIYSMAVNPRAFDEELPMLAVAESISPVLMYVYAALLFVAMSGASLACLIPMETYFAEHFKGIEKHGAATIFAISFFTFLLSCMGFSDLIGTLFSSFGYISILIVVGIAVNYIKALRTNKER